MSIQFLSQIKSANRAAGFYFFEPDTMRFFKSRALDQVFDGPRGVFFVTSERDGDNARRYTVRCFNRESGDVKTHGEFQGFKSRTGAISAARRASEGCGSPNALGGKCTREAGHEGKHENSQCEPWVTQ